MKILIVDDEQLARERLKDLLQSLDAANALLEADNGLTALAMTESEHPDAIMLDIRMPGMDGLEAALHLAKLPSPPVIIFTTAYEEHALAAFEANAVDYLLKPVRRERLQGALARASVYNQARITALRTEDSGRRARTYLSAAGHNGIRLLAIDEVRCLKADQKYVCVIGKGKELLITESLKALEAEFPDRFLRIHRNALIAPEFITALERTGDGTFQIRLRDVTKPLTVSRRHLPDVRRAIKR